MWSPLTTSLDLQMNPTCYSLHLNEMVQLSVCRVDVVETSKQELNATVLSLFMEENANHRVLKFYPF